MGELSIERDHVFRIRTERTPGLLAKALAAAGEHGANIGEIETVHIGADHNIREVAIIAPDEASLHAIADAMAAIDGVELLPGQIDKVWEQHRDGKIRIRPYATVRTLQDVREVYTPGVARVVEAIVADPSVADTLTWRGNTIAIVTNGTRVLGMGDVGPLASLPVMEGKSLFYAKMVDVNAVPIVVDADDPHDLIETIVRIAPGFGGIHLEDIATPGVYEIERELESRLDVPVFHDDQHGTAVVVAAAVISAARRSGLDIGDLVFGQVGLGAAGSAIAALASGLGFREVVAYDPSQSGVDHLCEVVDPAAPVTATTAADGLDTVIDRADVLVMTTGRAGLLDPARVRPGQVIMALTNPVPEITPAAARAAGAGVAADGSIVNNVLSFPGLFRGALDARATAITAPMKRAAATAIADVTPEGLLLPDPLDPAVHRAVADAVAAAATTPR
ncbi:MAG: NAD-dependent malic enzyme [Acidimicrobiia bacterium]|nr:NAD-dependent malic enzyme [Acidimicrobiia bacterium]